MIITTKIKMDLSNHQNTPVLNAVQSDKYSRNLEISLLDNGVPWNPPAGVKAVVRYARKNEDGRNYETLPDGNVACTIDGNILTVALAPDVCLYPGMVDMVVGLIDDEQEINTFNIGVDVHKNPGMNVASENGSAVGVVKGYYELDLTDVVSFETDSAEAVDFNVSDAYDWSKVRKAVDRGNLVRVHFMENNNLREAVVLLTDFYIVEGADAYYLQCVYAPRGSTNYFKLRVEFAYDEEFKAYDAFVIFTPGSTTSGGGSGIELDATLTQAGKAAESKAVGDKLGVVEDVLDAINGTGTIPGVDLSGYVQKADLEPFVIVPDHETMTTDKTSEDALSALASGKTVLLNLNDELILPVYALAPGSMTVFFSYVDDGMQLLLTLNGNTLTPEVFKFASTDDIPTDAHINGLINTALAAIPNAAEVAY